MVSCNLVGAFERLVVRNKSEIGTPQVTSKALGAPNDAGRCHVEPDPVTFRLERSAADEHDGADGIVVLLVFENSAEAVHTGITVEKRAGVVGDAVSVRVRTGGVNNSATSSRTMASMAEVRTNLTPCFRREVMGRIRLGIS